MLTTPLWFPLAVLILLLLIILLRPLFKCSLSIASIMGLGAILMLATHQLTGHQAWQAIDWSILGYLIGVFMIGRGLELSGLLAQVAEWCLRLTTSSLVLLALLMLFFAISSALLMNDTLAIIGTSLLLTIARRQGIACQPLLLALAYSITIGSVMSPIGNPQNLIIASQGGLLSPGWTFIKTLAIPTFINLGIAYGLIAWRYRQVLTPVHIHPQTLPEKDHALATCCLVALAIFVGLIVLRLGLPWVQQHLTLPMIALVAAIPLLFSASRWTLIATIDWRTLLFFVGLFVVVAAVWDSGLLQHALTKHQHTLTQPNTILGVSLTLSQLISNVPLVMLYLPILTQHQAHTIAFMALAAGSTIAGNCFIFGAASNVIIAENAPKHSLSMATFSMLGIPLAVINVLVYAVWFAL